MKTTDERGPAGSVAEGKLHTYNKSQPSQSIDVDEPTQTYNQRSQGMGGIMGNAFGQQNQNRSASIVARALQGLQGSGVQGLLENSKNAATQSMMSRLMDGPQIDPEEDLPNSPGFAYLSHLFKATGAGDKLKDKHKKAITKGMNIMTNAPDGVKTALKMLGMAGDNNVDGLPIDQKDILKLFHGDKADQLDDIERNEFLRDIGDGNTKIDRKKVRKFVNQDGSLTWEILNDDKKTIMSRFTFGEYNGTKLFAQGGYKQFGDLLRQARQQLGPDRRSEFDSIRNKYQG